VLFARSLAEAGRPEEAEAFLRALIRADPEFEEYAYNLGVLLMQQGRDADAVAAFEEALRRNPDAVHVLANLALVLSRTSADEAGRDRALALVDRAIALAEDDRPRLVKIDVCRNIDRPELAREAARELAEAPRLRGITRRELADAMRRL
jgi:tetratricopeptide (TPR) repeat protein